MGVLVGALDAALEAADDAALEAADDAADDAGADDDDAGALVGSGALVGAALDEATLDATDDDDAAGALVGGTGVAVGAGAHAARATKTINMRTNTILRFICFFSSKRMSCKFFSC
jgi:hypothetical protein